MVTNLCLVMVWISLFSTEDGTKKTYLYHKHKSETIQCRRRISKWRISSRGTT